MQENVCKCTKVHEIRENFLLRTIPDIRYVLSYHMCLATFLYGSDHTEYTRKCQLTEGKSKQERYVRTTICYVCTGKEWRLHHQLVD